MNEPHITVIGLRPAGPVTVTYAQTKADLNAILNGLVPIPSDLYPEVEARVDWLCELAYLAAGIHPEQQTSFQPLLARIWPARVAVVFQTYPPVVVCEMPFDAVSNDPPEQKKPIYGPSGERVQ